MTMHNETMMLDAAASVETAYMMSTDEPFVGTITNSAGDTEDWIGIEMEAGTTYTITVTGTLSSMNGGAMDTILTLYDDKGGMIDSNDDDTGMGNVSPGSKLVFTPEVDATYYISVSTYRNNPNLDNSGTYTVMVEGVVIDPTMGMAINGTPRVVDPDPDTDPVIEYESGNDKLTGTDVAETINGLSGDDTLNGMGGDDELNGGDDNDLLIGGPGADELNGGDGQDTIDYSYSMEGVTINLDDGTARGGDADGDTIGSDIEHVRGSMHDDSLTGARVGTSRHNKLWGLGGNDELDGLRGRDELYGGAGDDDLDGGDDNDILEGGYGADMLTGGDDTEYNGHKGDTASYSMSMMGVTVRLHSGQAMGGDAEGDTFAGSGDPVEYQDGDEEMQEANVYDIEHLTGSAMADILAGDLRDNTIKGGGGDDKLYGGPNPADADKEGNSGLTNADTLEGGPGNDMLFGGFGVDTLKGDAGDDMLNGGPGADMLYGGAGSDMIYADTMDTVINGWVETPPADDTNTGDVDESTEAHNDPMAVDTVSFARLEDETVGVTDAGGATAVIWELGTSAPNVENVIGSQGNDNINGTAVDNVIEGGEGADVLNGGANGMGGDTLSYESSDDWVRIILNGDGVDGAQATASRGHASGDRATNFENVRGSAFDDDLTGNGGANKLWGLAGDDDIDGGGGNDTIEGGAGEDKLDGGYSDGGTAGAANTEANTVSYAASDAGVTVNLVTSSVSGGHAMGDTIVTYEESAPTDDDPNNEIDVATFRNATGSMHNDHLTGNHHDNMLVGGAGDDTIRGGASDPGDRTQAQIRGDVLVGGPGADMLDGGEEMGEKNDMTPGVDLNNDGDFDDTVDGVAETAPARASVDWAVYKHAMGGVTVDLSTNRGTGGEAMGDTLRNIELIWGSEMGDTFIAGPGNDIIEGDGGSDTVSYEASEMGVTVNLGEAAQHTTVPVTGTAPDLVFPTDPDPVAVTAPATLLAGIPRLNAQDAVLTDADGANPENEDTNPNVNGAAGDRLRSIENLTGSNMKDDLDGDANPNVLKGLGGDDELTGAGGADTLEGGAGDDMLNGDAGEDKLSGGAGDDTLNGGDDADTLTGGPGNDDLSGGGNGTTGDTFVFSTDDAGDSDAILDWTDGDMIDLSAFELTAEQVIAAMTVRGTGADAYVVINLEAHGGGRITIDDVSTLDTFDTATGASADGTITDQAADGAIQSLDTDIFILG